jgi:transcription antitermination protein NusB
MQKYREAVFQLLYSYDIGNTDVKGIVDLLMSELAVTKKTIQNAQGRVQLIRTLLPEIDALIGRTSQSYAFDRIQTVERNVLRLGIFEMLFDDAIPPKVAIAEALRLARKFSTKESASFVNAILDSLYKSSIGVQANTKALEDTAKELARSEQIALEASLNPVKTTNDDLNQ